VSVKGTAATQQLVGWSSKQLLAASAVKPRRFTSSLPASRRMLPACSYGSVCQQGL